MLGSLASFGILKLVVESMAESAMKSVFIALLISSGGGLFFRACFLLFGLAVQQEVLNAISAIVSLCLVFIWLFLIGFFKSK